MVARVKEALAALGCERASEVYWKEEMVFAF